MYKFMIIEISFHRLKEANMRIAFRLMWICQKKICFEWMWLDVVFSTFCLWVVTRAVWQLADVAKAVESSDKSFSRARFNEPWSDSWKYSNANRITLLSNCLNCFRFCFLKPPDKKDLHFHALISIYHLQNLLSILSSTFHMWSKVFFTWCTYCKRIKIIKWVEDRNY